VKSAGLNSPSVAKAEKEKVVFGGPAKRKSSFLGCFPTILVGAMLEAAFN
jgi:hypothetical protein